MRLSETSTQESAMLVALLAIANQLPEPMPEYTSAIGELSPYFRGSVKSGGKRGVHNPSPGSLAQPREVRASKRWT